jgi:peroxiredoxin
VIGDPHQLPPDLPVPTDDGAADHLPGIELPDLNLPASDGTEVILREAGATLVLYIYPRTAVPGQPLPPGWDEIPGARGCTPQNCSFRDLHGELRALGATVYGLSAQDLREQREFAEREGIPYPLLNDLGFRLDEAIGLPTFEAGGMRLYKRLTAIAVEDRIERIFYPVFPPDRNAAEVLEWLTTR